MRFPIYEAAAPLARDLLRAEGLKDVVDLGSGSGGPWPALLRAPGLEEVRLTLTDRALDPCALRAFDDDQRESVRLGPQTQDLLAPADLPGLRTAFACLHHLAPDELEGLFAEVAHDGHPFLGIEVTERKASAIARQFLLFPAALVAVLFIRPTLAQLALTYLLPVIPLALVWDGVVSCLRSYDPDELCALARQHAPKEYVWDVGRTSSEVGPVHLIYLLGRRSTH